MNEKKLIFDAAMHRYFYDGKELPSVTKIIRGAGLMPDYFVGNLMPMHYGTQVHTAIAAILGGTEPELDVFVAVAVEGFREWRILYKPEILAFEKPGVDPLHGFAGTLDIAARIDGHVWLIDVKTGDPASWHVVQLAAYDKIFSGELKITGYACLYLDHLKAGKFEFKIFSRNTIQAGFSVFLNALNINKWKEQQNGK